MASVNKVNPSTVKPVVPQGAPQGVFAKCAGRCGLPGFSRSTIAPVVPEVIVPKKNCVVAGALAIRNGICKVVAAIRKCLSCIPLVGRLFVVAKPAAPVPPPVAPKPSFAASVANAVLSSLSKTKGFVSSHKALTAGSVVALGTGAYFHVEIAQLADQVAAAAKARFA